MGFEALRHQENYREEWKEDAVRATAEALGFDFDHASYGSVDEVYLAVLDRDTRGFSRERLRADATSGLDSGRLSRP